MLFRTALCVGLLTAAGPSLVAKAEPSTATPPPALDETALDRSVSPCDDFYQFACGGWIAKAEIPPDRAIWSRGIYSIEKRNEELLHAALEGFAAGSPEALDAEQRKLGDYYGACTAEAGIEATSLAALKRRLAPVDAIKDAHTLAVQIARAHLEDVGVFFAFGASQDMKDSAQMIGEVDQGGLGLPDRDYYLSDDAKMQEIRELYRDHVQRLLVLLGEAAPAAKADAQTVMTIETALARASTDRVARRDPKNVYHRLERTGLAKLTPAFEWDTYFDALGVPAVQAINVAEPGFFTQLEALLKTTSLPQLKAYMRYHVVARAAPALAKAFVDEDFHFASKALTGQAELPPRWKRCVGATTGAMAQAVGKIFVAKTFGPAAKSQAKAMIGGIEAALQTDLESLAWMDEPTRTQALAKLARVANQVGYPDKWRSYDGLKVTRASYLDNTLAASLFNSRYYLGKIGRPVDRGEWYMPPSMVNAYYSSDNNKMVFPAGILQAPFYDAEHAPAAVNYGAIGMVMGHELTHGFDDQGRKFDASGNLKDWWTPNVAKEFDTRASCLVDQYSRYTVLDKLHINGKLTLGENIADQGGIQLAFRAWRAATEGKGDEINGFTPAQQFFVGYAQSWCSKLRPEFARMRVTTDPHSPPQYRVNGALSNFDEFQVAFACKQGGAPMAPANRCKIW